MAIESLDKITLLTVRRTLAISTALQVKACEYETPCTKPHEDWIALCAHRDFICQQHRGVYSLPLDPGWTPERLAS